MLKFLFGVLAGYILANFYFAMWVVKKGYKSLYDIPDKR
jgi:hypothetical protein